MQELNSLQGTRVKDYVLEKKLGEGSFSVVYKAINAKNPKLQYAIKIMKTIPQNNQYAVKNEIMLLKKINNKNVIKCIEDFTDQKNLKYIVLEYCGKGDLSQFFKKQGKLPQTVCRKLASSLIHVFSQLHSKGIVHRDLKLANILITDQYQFKIADFGMAKLMDKGICQTQCGTPYAMPPQIIKCQKYNDKCDVWSLGVMIYQVAYGKIPFTAKRQYQLRKIILQNQPVFDPEKQISNQCINFIKKCLIKNKDARPSMQELKDHPWFNQTGATMKCMQFFKGSFEQKNNKVMLRTKQMLVEVTKQHLKGIIKQYKLTKNEIQNCLKWIQKNQLDGNLKQNVLLGIDELIKELKKCEVNIKMQQKNFKVKLSEVKIFKQHLSDLQSYLNPLVSKLTDQQKKSNFLLELIRYTLHKTQKSLGLENQQKQYINYIYYICKLPLYIPQNSSITIKWAYQQITQGARKNYDKYLGQLKNQEIINVINSDLSNSQVLNNWLIQHNFSCKRRQGGQYKLGEYMVKILEINSTEEQ